MYNACKIHNNEMDHAIPLVEPLQNGLPFFFLKVYQLFRFLCIKTARFKMDDWVRHLKMN